MRIDENSQSEYFIAKAEQCFRIARHLRSALSQTEAAAELDALAHDLLAHAVEIDTERDRAETRRRAAVRR